MIIDFHTHIFPDEIASKAIKKLESLSNMEAKTNGTLNGLIQTMKKSEVDYSVVLPVVTNPDKTVSINDFSILQNKKKSCLIFFGGMHPDTKNYEEEIVRLKKFGVKGIKIHPDYQNTFIDDERYIKIIDAAFKEGLIVVTHAGIDIGISGETKATPIRIKEMKSKLKYDGVLILAHMGGWKMWNEVYQILDKGIYIDTAFSLGELKTDKIEHLMDKEIFEKFILKYGSDKIIFGTDSPWGDPKEFIDEIRSFNLKKKDMDNILGENAKNLLNL